MMSVTLLLFSMVYLPTPSVKKPSQVRRLSLLSMSSDLQLLRLIRCYQGETRPIEDCFVEHVATFDADLLHAIAKLCSDPQMDFSDELISTEFIQVAIHAIQSQVVPPEEETLGHFTRRTLEAAIHLERMTRHKTHTTAIIP